MSMGRIVFMGTPAFAVPCLQKIIEEGYTLCGVFTQPDKPKGRGYKLAPPPVKELALQHNIPVFQPATLKTEEAVQTLKDLQADVIVVVAYGKILPPSVLSVPPLGCVNIHASLLPKYRGAAPIQWSVMSGDTVTGVTSMYMAQGLDTGDMIYKEELSIGPDETAGELHDRLSLVGSRVLAKTLKDIFSGTAPRYPQPENQGNYASMLTKETAKISWGEKAGVIHNLVRGLNPWPVAYSTLDGKQIKIYAVRPHAKPSGAHFGQVTVADPSRGLYIACKDGQIEILQLQAEGGRRMTAVEYLKGHPIPTGSIFI